MQQETQETRSEKTLIDRVISAIAKNPNREENHFSILGLLNQNGVKASSNFLFQLIDDRLPVNIIQDIINTIGRVEINAKDSAGNNALMHLILKEKASYSTEYLTQLIELLLDKGIPISGRNNAGVAINNDALLKTILQERKKRKASETAKET